MNPFDLELVKAGHPICTRDGRQAKIVWVSSHPMVLAYRECIGAVVTDREGHDRLRAYYTDGVFLQTEGHGNDLMMAENTLPDLFQEIHLEEPAVFPAITVSRERKSTI